jgi:hypothetical protein
MRRKKIKNQGPPIKDIIRAGELGERSSRRATARERPAPNARFGRKVEEEEDEVLEEKGGFESV